MIAIIGAMKEEVDALLNRMSDVKEKGEQIYQGKFAQHDVIICTSGVGKVNAAYSTSKILSNYDIDLLINIGSAGGLLEGQKVGDIVIANKLQYHDFDIGPETVNDERFIFYPNKQKTELLEEVLNDLDLSYHHGLMVSGDQFIIKTSPAFKNIQKKFPKAHCVEMEAAAIAHVASRFKVPFLVMRALSDVTFNNEDQIEFEKYLPLAAKQSALICTEFIKVLSYEK